VEGVGATEHDAGASREGDAGASEGLGEASELADAFAHGERGAVDGAFAGEDEANVSDVAGEVGKTGEEIEAGDESGAGKRGEGEAEAPGGAGAGPGVARV